MRLVIAGATGHVGRPLVEGLAARGHEVRAIARSADKLATLPRGVKPFPGNVANEAFLRKTLGRADAVFVMIPPHATAADLRAHQRRIASAWAGAIHAAGVPRVVSLSSVGASLRDGTGPITGLHDLERALDALDHVHVLHLRPTYFMENLLVGIALIKTSGIIGSALRADLAMPMIASRDIAAVALDILAKPQFTGKSVRELLGPRDYTQAEATRILGGAIGKGDLGYVEFPYDQARQAMLGAGLSASVADAYIEMQRGFNDGLIRPTEARSATNTTPTTLEAFAEQVFSRAFAA